MLKICKYNTITYVLTKPYKYPSFLLTAKRKDNTRLMFDITFLQDVACVISWDALMPADWLQNYSIQTPQVKSKTEMSNVIHYSVLSIKSAEKYECPVWAGKSRRAFSHVFTSLQRFFFFFIKFVDNWRSMAIFFSSRALKWFYVYKCRENIFLSVKPFSFCLFISLSTFFYELFFFERARDARAMRDSRRKNSSLACAYPMRRINILMHSFFFYKNTCYKNIKAEICEILTISYE